MNTKPVTKQLQEAHSTLADLLACHQRPARDRFPLTLGHLHDQLKKIQNETTNKELQAKATQLITAATLLLKAYTANSENFRIESMKHMTSILEEKNVSESN